MPAQMDPPRREALGKNNLEAQNARILGQDISSQYAPQLNDQKLSLGKARLDAFDVHEDATKLLTSQALPADYTSSTLDPGQKAAIELQAQTTGQANLSALAQLAATTTNIVDMNNPASTRAAGTAMNIGRKLAPQLDDGIKYQVGDAIATAAKDRGWDAKEYMNRPNANTSDFISTSTRNPLRTAMNTAGQNALTAADSKALNGFFSAFGDRTGPMDTEIMDNMYKYVSKSQHPDATFRMVDMHHKLPDLLETMATQAGQVDKKGRPDVQAFVDKVNSAKDSNKLWTEYMTHIFENPASFGIRDESARYAKPAR